MIVSESKAFQINDIFFAVGASSISIQKEALSYKFHVLRQNSSSKLPTGHGGCIVNVGIRVPREDVLKLHRLIIQVKQNPFVFVENKFLRKELCPGWDTSRNMAFSVLNLGLESVPGNVGLFDLQLQMQWFNYFPYSQKFWFRKDWETEWIPVSSLSAEAKSLLRAQQSDEALYIRKSIFDYTTKISMEQQRTSTFDEMIKKWTPAVFDLLPIGASMIASKGVQNPRDSKIYVRYYNQLQADALKRNFNIDVVNMVGFPAFHDDLLSGVGSSVINQAANAVAADYVDIGPEHIVSSGVVSLYDARTLPELLAATGNPANGVPWSVPVIEKMLEFDDFVLSYNEYTFVDLPETFKATLSGGTNTQVKEAIEVQEEINKVVPPNTNGNLSVELLTTIGNGHLMQHAAAKSYQDMVAAAAYAGISWTITDSYRNYASQVKVAKDKGLYTHGGLAATPGTSNHGRGLAVDLGGGVNKYGTPQHEWLKNNAARFGFFNIDREPWHWEYRGNGTVVVPNSSDGAESALSSWTIGDSKKPWYDVFNNLHGSMSEADLKFFETISYLKRTGWKYYSKDPSVNGVFFRCREPIHVDGHREFRGTTNSHDTILSKWSATLRHIISALPILSHEFPTHQHLGSIDPVYRFEFVTVDHEDNNNPRAGIGVIAEELERSRTTLATNGRDIKTIYDSWMADADNFITRLMGTYSDTSSIKEYNSTDGKARRIVISASQAETLVGQPGTSVYILQCEEAQPFVSEALTRTNTSTKSTNEEIIKKVVKKTLEVSAVTRDLNLPKTNWFPEADNQQASFGQFTFAVLLSEEANSYANMSQNESQTQAYANSVNFLKAKESLLTGKYNNEEIAKVDAFCRSLGTLNALAELILWEKEFGGLGRSSGKFNYDFYGLEKNVMPKGGAFLDHIAKNMSMFSKYLVYSTQRWIAGAAKGLAIAGTKNMVVDYVFGTEVSGSTLGNLHLAGKAFVNGAYEDKKAIGEFLISLADGSTDVMIQEGLVLSYLKDVFDLTGSFAVPFVSATSDWLAGWITTVIPQDPTKSAINGEVFGIAKTCIKQLNKNRISSTVLPAEEKFEKAKSEYIKAQIAALVQTIYNDPFLTEFFGIVEDVAELYNHNVIDERDALPDLELPAHPYFGKTYLTPPDFYYYNDHEDGQQSDNIALQEDFFENMRTATDNIYDFMDALQKGDVAKYTAALEGDVTGYEVTASFDNFDHTTTSEQEKVLTGKENNPGQHAFVYKDGEGDSMKFSGERDSISLLGSNFGSSPLYDQRISPELLSRVQNAEAHFGKVEGFANERAELKTLNSDIALNDKASFAHFSDKKSIFDIVKESSSDITSQKFTMKRAFPTFRLYMIEEDQTEDFLMRYDDFYHYNAIRDITVVRSRDIAGDTAVIVMQNISGLLDGSKRMVLKDTDYLSDQKMIDGTNTSKGDRIQEGRKPVNEGTGDEEPIQSMILRPGVNIQLRMGYGNDPNNLPVKLSGRLVDLSYSANGDQVEITVQGFGAELVQVQKGLNPNETKAYTVTHRLLGALMFEPELVHFGRFESGKQLQFGENKDSKLDFRVYKPNAAWSKLTNVYYANTANQLADIWDSTTDSFIPSEKGTLWGAAKSVVRTPVNGVETAGAFVWDTFTAPFKALYSASTARIKNEFTQTVSYALTSPQDDNLFCPNPKDYVMKPNWLWAAYKRTIKDTWNGDGAFYDFERSQKIFGKFIKTSALALQSPRLDIDELEYVPQNSTIFQIFREMTLRHPGYVFSPVPYGNEFRYTMFFGVPSQRYWSKPAHNLFISRTNQLRKALGGVMGDEGHERAGTDGAFKESTHTFSDFYTELKAMFSTNRYEARTGKTVNVTDVENEQILKSLGVKTYAEALLQYYQALSLRFVPFRRYHMATSETDIISNNITATEYGFANAVSVKYYDTAGDHEQVDEIAVKIHDAIPEEHIRMKSVDYRNCKGPNLALRYGTGELVYEAKKMYQGEILLVGNSRIRPWDVVVLVDRYNDIVGPVEVEQVVDRLSFETGYVTEIKPNAMVFANEISSFPILEGVKQIIAGKLKEENSLYFDWKNVTPSPLSLLMTAANPYYQALKEGVTEGVTETIGLPTVANPVSSTQSYFMSGAWVMGGFFYLMKCAQGQSVIIYPLLKHGLPFIAGVPSGRPETMWSIFNGRVNLFLNDVTSGTLEFLSHWKLLGFSGVRAFGQDAKLSKFVSKASNNIKAVPVVPNPTHH